MSYGSATTYIHDVRVHSHWEDYTVYQCAVRWIVDVDAPNQENTINCRSQSIYIHIQTMIGRVRLVQWIHTNIFPLSRILIMTLTIIVIATIEAIALMLGSR